MKQRTVIPSSSSMEIVVDQPATSSTTTTTTTTTTESPSVSSSNSTLLPFVSPTVDGGETTSTSSSSGPASLHRHLHPTSSSTTSQQTSAAYQRTPLSSRRHNHGTATNYSFKTPDPKRVLNFSPPPSKHLPKKNHPLIKRMAIAILTNRLIFWIVVFTSTTMIGYMLLLIQHVEVIATQTTTVGPVSSGSGGVDWDAHSQGGGSSSTTPRIPEEQQQLQQKASPTPLIRSNAPGRRSPFTNNDYQVQQLAEKQQQLVKSMTSDENSQPSRRHEELTFKRIVYWNDDDDEKEKQFDETSYIHNRTTRTLEDDPMMHAPPGEEAAPQLEELSTEKQHHDECKPIADWQTSSFPNCNVVHEIDLRSAGPNVGLRDSNIGFESLLTFLGRGWFRHTWKLETSTTTNENDDASSYSIVLKTLRLERDFLEEYYELHRRDAVAMERLTQSPFVLDVYGYCGQSALNELADFPYGMNSLEKFNRNLRGRDGPEVNLLKLQVAASIAVGVAHMHEIDDIPSLVHYDLNPRNVAIVKGGKPKINDFNIAEFLRYNPNTNNNKTCGFPARLHEPWWRAPEEVNKNTTIPIMVNEKVDVYSLGNLLYHTFTTHSPRGKMKQHRMEEVREIVLNGIAPEIPSMYKKTSDPVHKVFRKAMRMCFELKPYKRATARQVADVLMNTLSELKETGYIDSKKNTKREGRKQ